MLRAGGEVGVEFDRVRGDEHLVHRPQHRAHIRPGLDEPCRAIARRILPHGALLDQVWNGQWGLNQIAQGRNLYVHCGAGHERSATFVAAILLKSKRCQTIEESMNLIKQHRSKARFVGNQQEILKEWLKE